MSNDAILINAIMKGKELGEFKRCRTCKELDYSNIHQCKPEYQAILKDYHDENEPERVFANGMEAAALAFAENNFSNWDFPKHMEIWVRQHEGDQWAKFEITVEAVPSFSALQIA